jgi:hypothetical protein
MSPKFLALLAMVVAAGCCRMPIEKTQHRTLIGAWRSTVQFSSGAFAAIKDLEFMYSFNTGGTMMESSNYDGSPPVPPAYGVWRSLGHGKYHARYAYFWTKPPAGIDEITKGGGWAPGGYGLLNQDIALSPDGQSFESTIQYEVFDHAGKATEPRAVATAKGRRIGF